MARIRKEEEHAFKRNEILLTARRLVLTKGYEQMSIQDILNEMKMSKGAFYYYFPSKPALLEGIIDQIQAEGAKVFEPVLTAPDLTALQKIEGFFKSASNWKSQFKPMIIQLMRMWYADENALVRLKTTARSLAGLTPLIAQVVRQGIEEGVFHTAFPEHTAEMIFLLQQGIGDAFAEVLLNNPNQELSWEQKWCIIKTAYQAYSEALERILGVEPGVLHLIDVDDLKTWLVSE